MKFFAAMGALVAAGSGIIGAHGSPNTLVLDLARPAPSVATIELAPVDLAAARSFEMVITVRNASGSRFSSITLNPLARSVGSGNVRLAVDRCSLPWEPAGDDPSGEQTFACSGTQSAALADRTLDQDAAALAGLDSLHHSGVDHLRVRLQAPDAGTTTPTEVDLTLRTS